MLEFILRILALMRKELLAVLKDPRSRFSILVPPMMQCLIFGYAASYDLNDVAYAVLNQDRQLALRSSCWPDSTAPGVFHRDANLASRRPTSQTWIDNRRACSSIQIRARLRAALLHGPTGQRAGDCRRPEFQHGRHRARYVGDVSTRSTPIGCRSIATKAARRCSVDDPRLVQSESRNALEHDSQPDRHVDDDADDAAHGDVGCPRARAGNFRSIAGDAISARRDHGGQGDAVGVDRHRPGHHRCFSWPSSGFAFHLPDRSSTLYVGLGVFLLAAVGIGLFLSSLVATMQQAMLFSFVVILPFSLLSGLTTPIANMPMVLQYFTYVNPLRYAIEITHRVYLEGEPARAALPRSVAAGGDRGGDAHDGRMDVRPSARLARSIPSASIVELDVSWRTQVPG